MANFGFANPAKPAVNTSQNTSSTQPLPPPRAEPKAEAIAETVTVAPVVTRTNPLAAMMERSRLKTALLRPSAASTVNRAPAVAVDATTPLTPAEYWVEPSEFIEAVIEYAEREQLLRQDAHGLEGEIIPPSRELATQPSAKDARLGTEIDSDHLRRAAMAAAEVFNIMEGISIDLDPSQVAAVHTLVGEQYGTMTGAAGTGKTTTTRALLHVLMNGDVQAGIEPLRISRVNMTTYHKMDSEEEDSVGTQEEDAMTRAASTRVPTIALCAFTGQATHELKKKLPPAWRNNVMTIHSLLGFAPVQYTKEDGTPSMRFEPSYTAENKMPWDAIVIDEGSMLGIDLWHMLLDACKPGCRIYMVGDLNQLPPTIGLSAFGFALARWKTCELTQVHRQSDPAANKILDFAHATIRGDFKAFQFDDPKTNPNWRVIGFELNSQAHVAHQEVVQIAYALSHKRVSAEVDPLTPLVYDPFRDRIMAPGNGYSQEETGYELGQSQINESLSKIFGNGEPRYVINAQRVLKRFAVGYRVMATRNESPGIKNRVTNGQTGRIINIAMNPNWFGDRGLVGLEEDVRAEKTARVLAATENARAQREMEERLGLVEDFQLEASDIHAGMNSEDSKISGPASHIVAVKFDNGAVREYATNAEIEQLQLAYASTVHKTQGAEMPTAIIVVHHANKFHLCRENLYTAITRASQRVVILYTQYGLRVALAKQKVPGRTMQEKIAGYMRMSGGDNGAGFKQVRVRMTEDDE